MRALHRFIACAFAAGVLIAAPACATTFTVRAGTAGEYGVEGQRRAYARGYDVGLDKGRQDARSGKRLDFEQHKEFRDGTKGYNRSDGDRGAYRDAFRDAFAKGYTEAYRANSRDRDDRDRSRRR